MLPRNMALLFRLTFLAVVFSEASTQLSTTSDFITSSCRGSQIQHDLPAEYVLNNFLRFSAIDKHGKAIMITDSLATQCGYKISQNYWGSITFRISLYSCYVQIKNDTYFTVPVMIEIASRPDMADATSYLKTTSCPYYWSPREVVCETNYMEVSVRRKIPVIAEGAFRSEPEDWASAFDSAVTGLMSIWQVVFYKTSTQKTTMLIDAALEEGYGINTTDARTLLRSSYNATEAVPQKVDGVTFSTVRATLFYKQRWFIYLVDNAMACPVDDVVVLNGQIIWTIPKNVYPLLIGAKTVQSSRYKFGLDLLNMTTEQILANKYEISEDVKTITVRIPVGADGGYYKSHVVNQEYGVTYNIKPFLENFWTDDGWGITKYTIIKDITTDFETKPPVITNGTIPSTMLFNVTISPFLPDVKLVNITIGDGVTLTVPQAIIEKFGLPNGTFGYFLKVPFLNPHVSKQVFPNGVLFTLNVTFGFNILPYNETFTISTTIESFMPYPVVGPCDQTGSMLTSTISNLDSNHNIYINDALATTNNGLLVGVNQTTSTVQVPAESPLVMHEAVGNGVQTVVPINIKDRSGSTVYSIVIICDLEYPAVCLPEGTIEARVSKIKDIPNMDLSRLRLRDPTCGPATIEGPYAFFSFHANTCGTKRTFENNFMIYNNAITYNNPATGRPLYIMNVTCNYTINGTMEFSYISEKNPTPSAQSVMGSLDLILRLSKDIAYVDFYGDVDYPVVKYLREPLYFEVQLLYSTDSRLELFLDSCWATKSPDMNSLPSWPIITRSCEHEELYRTIFHVVTATSRVKVPSHFKRFEVKTFSFMDGNKPYTGAIYFHCDVIICDSSNLASDQGCGDIGSCIPRKQRMGRSVNENIRSISSRAVVLLAQRLKSHVVQY